MNAIAGRLVAAYRDQFGVHGGSDRVVHRFLNALTASRRRVSAALRHRVTLEEGIWLLIAALIIGFLVVLFFGDVGHGGYGRF